MATTDALGGSGAPAGHAGIIGATMRLSVLADGGPRVDLVVPVWAEVADVASSAAESLGAPTAPTLRRTTGAVLDPQAPLERAGLRHGTVLLASWPTAEAPGPTGSDPAGETVAHAAGTTGAAGWRRWSVTAAALAVVAAAGAGLASRTPEADGLVPTVAAALLALAALPALAPVAPG
ncbi:EsaB/YukD family protein, partial [Nocardioides korecus]